MSSRNDSDDTVPVRVARALEAMAQNRLQSADVDRSGQLHELRVAQSEPLYVAGDCARQHPSQARLRHY